MSFRSGFIAALLLLAGVDHAQAGPPFFTNDPGTPGNANWEINLASAQTLSRGVASYQIPQIDLNFGLGERVQLTYEVPYVMQGARDSPRRSGWSNGFSGVKWRFIDQGEGGWQVATFPQIETNGSPAAQRAGIAGPGSRVLLPFELTKKVGVVDVDFEAGFYLPKSGVRERILGLVVGRSITDRWDFGAELYNDRAVGAPIDETTINFGGRFKLGRGFIALFSAGRSVSGTGNGQPLFVGYVGVQILLGDYGQALIDEPPTVLRPAPKGAE